MTLQNLYLTTLTKNFYKCLFLVFTSNFYKCLLFLVSISKFYKCLLFLVFSSIFYKCLLFLVFSSNFYKCLLLTGRFKISRYTWRIELIISNSGFEFLTYAWLSPFKINIVFLVIVLNQSHIFLHAQKHLNVKWKIQDAFNKDWF